MSSIRTAAHTKHRAMWDTMKDCFDTHLDDHLAGLHGKLDAVDLVVRYFDVLSLFVGEDDLKTVHDSMKRREDPPTAVMLRVLNSCQTAKNLFAEQSARLDNNLFLQTARQRVRDLEHLDFSEVEVANYERIMVAESRRLWENGHVNFERRQVSVEFLGAPMNVLACDPTEMWLLMLMARVKTIAVHTGQVPALPWETTMMEAAPLELVPELLTLSEKLVRDSTVCRKAALKVLGSAKTFREMRSAISSQLKMLTELDKTFALESTYLETVLEEKASKVVQNKILSCLPAEGSAVTMKQAPPCGLGAKFQSMCPEAGPGTHACPTILV